MVVELIDKLIDSIIKLYKFRKESKKKLFLNFIEPIYSDFETIHNEYLKSFRKYRHILKDTKISLKELIDKIREDYLSS